MKREFYTSIGGARNSRTRKNFSFVPDDFIVPCPTCFKPVEFKKLEEHGRMHKGGENK